MTERPVVVLANPAAGSGDAVRRAGRLVAALRERGQPARLVCPADAVQTSELAEQMAPAAAALIACGGDGTVNLVMNACLRTGTVFGVLPAGTGDDNARSLGVPADVDALAHRIADSLGTARGVRHVDVAEAICADGPARAFLGVMSTGIDSTVNERANHMVRLPGTLRYIAALGLELMAMHPVECSVTVDGVDHRGPALLASIGNGSSYGGGMRVCPDAEMDDGLLDVTVLSHVSRSTFVRVFPRVFQGTHVRHPAVTTLRGAQITVAAEGAVAYADGERFGALPVTVTVRAKALPVIGAQTA